MARRAAKIDSNQQALVEVMRQLGMSVEITSSVHAGFPDTVVGYGGITVLVEIKDGDKPPSGRQLTPKQVELHNRFQGAITVIENREQAEALVHKIRHAACLLGNIDWDVGATAYASQTREASHA